jgi:L-alanine-DL-glutamate epimerase-like enolase superfamily enzyme
MIDYAGLGFVQIDAGRIGGITTAKQVADYAAATGVRYVNHTFTTHLALSASVQPYAGLEAHELCEYPVEASSLAQELTGTRLLPDGNGLIALPEKPGLGIEPDVQAIRKYLVEVEIKVAGQVIFQSSRAVV